MAGASVKEITGAWVIHHGRKLVLDANGPAEFSAIDEAAKAATLLTKLGQSNQTNIPKTEVRAIAAASGLNPRHELTGLLQVLEKKRLIDQSDDEVSVLGVTTRGALGLSRHVPRSRAHPIRAGVHQLSGNRVCVAGAALRCVREDRRRVSPYKGPGRRLPKPS